MKKNREKPMEMERLEVLLRRGIADEFVRQEWRMKYSYLQAGYIGERRVDNEWREINVPGILWHDFTCRNSAGNTHQMDTVFICKHFILVLEIKNVSGRIDFDDKRRQFLRTCEDGRIESFNNPIDQVKRHRDLLQEFSLNWPFYVPVEAFVVIANPSTVIGRISSEVPVFNVSGLRTKVQELVRKHASANLNVRMIKTELESLYRPIERRNVYNYPIRSGVFCEECGAVMLHRYKVFYCPKCKWRDDSEIALRRALHDYRIFYGDRISNQAFRDFVGITNIYTANKMLKKLFSNREGKNKGQRYIILPSINKFKK